MTHPVQDVQIHGVTQKAPSAKVKKRWRVRWMVDGRAHDKAFATSNEATRYRSLLVAAHHRGERFDRDTGEPVSWQLLKAFATSHNGIAPMAESCDYAT